MRIAIAGGTGRIGRLTIEALAKAGHQAVALSRRAGADAYTGAWRRRWTAATHSST